MSQLEMNLTAATAPLDFQIALELNQATQPLLEALGPSVDYYESPENDRTR